VTRVCHITTVHPIDDHRILYKECLTLRAAGYDVTLIAPHQKDAVLERIPVVALRGPAHGRLRRMTQRPLAAYRAAVAVDADLYHFHDPDFLPYGVRLARAGKRVVYDAHEDLPLQVRSKEWIPAGARPAAARAFARLEAACVGRLDAVVVANPWTRERLGRHQSRIVRVANFPRLGEIGPAAAWDDRSRAACYVGGITRLRGVGELIDAMAHAEEELLLAGAISPPELRAELERSPGWERVRYVGRVGREQVAQLLAEAKVGVVPLKPTAHYQQIYPVKLFEYLAAGLPVVATEVPTWRQILETHDCGVTVPFGDPRHLAEAIRGLLDDDDRARAMGKRARLAAEERFSWETEAAVLVGLYDDLLS
jgi:glycosyltransferase involved in cell wall biosynthesis